MQIPDDLKAVLIAVGIIAILLIVLVASKDSGPKYKIKEVKEPVITKPVPKKAPVNPPKPQWIACPKCNGTGYQECWRCRPSWFATTKNRGSSGTYCKACEGKGEHYILGLIVKCGRCNGTGDAGDICPTCNGTGRDPYNKCWHCKGTGRIRR